MSFFLKMLRSSLCVASCNIISSGSHINGAFVVSAFSSSSSSRIGTKCVAPETTPEQRQQVQAILEKVFGRPDSNDWLQRRQEARRDDDEQESTGYDDYQLVYGELGLDALCTILDAVEVHEGDNFLDIGSGDGHLVQAAALLWPNYLQVSRGLELLDFLYQRSMSYDEQLQDVLAAHEEQEAIGICPTEFYIGDIYSVANGVAPSQLSISKAQEEVRRILKETTLAICFATTWTRGIPGRRLPMLAKSLISMPVGSRIVVVDGKLECDEEEEENWDGRHHDEYYKYRGQLQFQCPDTAPHSIAHLYERL